MVYILCMYANPFVEFARGGALLLWWWLGGLGRRGVVEVEAGLENDLGRLCVEVLQQGMVSGIHGWMRG